MDQHSNILILEKENNRLPMGLNNLLPAISTVNKNLKGKQTAKKNLEVVMAVEDIKEQIEKALIDDQ